jgi:hypothetical protein
MRNMAALPESLEITPVLALSVYEISHTLLARNLGSERGAKYQ